MRLWLVPHLLNSCFCQSFKFISFHGLFFTNIPVIIYGILHLRTSKCYSQGALKSIVVFFTINFFWFLSCFFMYIWCCDIFLASLDRILLQITHCYLSLYYQIQLQNNWLYKELYFRVKRVVSSFWSPYLGN